MEIRFRPTFRVPIEPSSSDTLSLLKDSTRQQPVYEGQFCDGHALISVEAKERHFWSPWLHLDIRNNEGQDVLFGRFSPHPSIWTAFVFSYLTLAVLSFFAVIVGWSQMLIKQHPWAFYIVPACVAFSVVLWIISQVGQRLAHAQMIQLRDFVENSLATPSSKSGAGREG